MNKLAIKLKDPELAEKLQAAGFANPRQIRDATDKELLAVEGLGRATLEKVRSKFSQE